MPKYKVILQVRDTRQVTVVAANEAAAGEKASKVVERTGLDVINYRAEEQPAETA